MVVTRMIPLLMVGNTEGPHCNLGEAPGRDIAEYAELSQQAMQLTTIISESVGNSRAVRGLVDAETCYTSNIDARRVRQVQRRKLRRIF